jgi:hypothetical protein
VQSSGTLADLISRTAQDNYPPLHNLLLFAIIIVSGSASADALGTGAKKTAHLGFDSARAGLSNRRPWQVAAAAAFQ